MALTKKTLDRLERAAAALNEASNGFTDTIEKLEARLVKSKIGLTVWLDEELDDPPIWKKEVAEEGNIEITKGWSLGYARIDDAWHFAIREIVVQWNTVTEEIETFPRGETKQLLKASRSARLWAAEHLEPLFKRLADKAEALVSYIEDAKKMAGEQ